MRKIFLLIFLISLSSLAAAANETNVFLTLANVITKEPIDDVFVTITGQEESRYFLENGQTLKLFLPNGNYPLKILINNPQTAGYDYFSSATLNVQGSVVQVIYLYPVGSLAGFVKDKLDNVISGADLKFTCNQVIPVKYPQKADNFGSFSIDAIPIGKCEVHGTYKGNVGSQEVDIIQGKKNQVEIKLTQVLVSDTQNSWPYIITGIFILLFVLSIGYRFKNTRTKTEPTSKLSTEITPSTVKSTTEIGARGKDILRTLRDNEKKIIHFLLEHNQPVHLSKIHYKTGISKGSLFRNLRSLERKNIIEKFEEGRVKKVKLSPWFLE